MLGVNELREPEGYCMTTKSHGSVRMSLTVAGPDQQMTANWSLAQVSLRGTPRNPQRVSFTAEKFTLDQAGSDKPDRLFTAEKGQLHGRLASGTVRDNPVIDVAATLKAATAHAWHPLAAQPFDFDGDTRLVGLRNFQPKSWSQRFKEIQQSNGRIEVRNARLKQGDMLAVATGNLKLTKLGYLDGELTVTASGIEKLLPKLGVEALARQGGNRSQRLGAALSLLDQMAPGAISGAVSLLGEQVELEGRRATKMPLRFKDGEGRQKCEWPFHGATLAALVLERNPEPDALTHCPAWRFCAAH